MNNPDEPRFDVFSTLADENKLTRLFENVSLAAAEILSGHDREWFNKSIERQGWSGTRPIWTDCRPIVIVPAGQLLREDQFSYLVELTS